MITITLPPELERVMEEWARQQGTTPNLLAIDSLTKLYLPPVAVTDEPAEEGETLADYWADYTGSVDSSEVMANAFYSEVMANAFYRRGEFTTDFVRQRIMDDPDGNGRALS